MKLYIFALIAAMAASCLQARETVSLAGEWSYCLDPKEEGTAKTWFNEPFTGVVRWPGSLSDNGIGKKGSGGGSGGWDFAYWYPEGWSRTDKGTAWYQKEVEIPASWKGKRITLFLERSRTTRVWVDGQSAGPAQDFLSTPHLHDLTALLSPGKHRISVAVDTLMRPNTGHQSWMQGRWNGVIGRIELQATDPVWVESVRVYPNVEKRTAKVRVTVGNATGQPQKGEVLLEASLAGDAKAKAVATGTAEFQAEGASAVCETELAMGGNVRLWSEFAPDLYQVKASLKAGASRDSSVATFGMREFKAQGRQFTVNGKPIFLRGRTDNAMFPKTAYPPMDVAEWKRLYGIAKSWGLNHFRFHSWCPPEAAFQAADEMGIFLQPEGSCNGGTEDPEVLAYIAADAKRLIDIYGNHPSFVMFSSGNEIHGPQSVFQQRIPEWKAQDDRHLYTHSTNGGGRFPLSDFWVDVSVGPRDWRRPDLMRQGALRGSSIIPNWGYIDFDPPSTMKDYTQALDDAKPKIDRPLITHEIGQYSSYPDFKEIPKYTGAVRLTNYEIFRKSLEEHHMLDQADDFLRASGELQVLLYREEIEADLRTPGLAGFQLLDLQDQQEQGTAVVGLLNALAESKGYGSPDEFREWCAPVVPLLRMKQYTWTTGETFAGDVQLAHYGPKALDAAVMKWSIQAQDGKIVASGTLPAQMVETGHVANLGHIEVPLANLPAPAVYTVTLSLDQTPIRNSWKIWLYPQTLPAEPSGEIVITEKWDASAEQALAAGKKVLYLPKPAAVPNSVEGAFITGFWSYAMFKDSNPAATLGILCDPKHPAFADFPTEFHSNWQWWDLNKRSRAVVIDAFPAGFRPLVQVIDNMIDNRKLGTLFEAKVGPGKLMVCSIDLVNDLDKRPVARQFRYSVLRYMAGMNFEPAQSLTLAEIAALGRSTSIADGIELAEPLGIHRAVLVVVSGASLSGKEKGWVQTADAVSTKKPEFDYSLNANCEVKNVNATTFWRSPRVELTFTSPKGWTGKLHIRVFDYNKKGRSAVVSLNGRKLGEIKEHKEGAWLVIPLTAEDTASGSVKLELVAPEKQDVVITDLVAMPTGANDPG